MLNLFAVLSLFSAIIMLILCVIILYSDKKNQLNIVFSILCAVESWLCFTEFMGRQETNIFQAHLWMTFQFMSPIVMGLLFHFVLIYNRSKLLKHWFAYLLIYAPAIYFSYLFFIGLSGLKPSSTYWGYTWVGALANPITSVIVPAWFGVEGCLVLLLLIIYAAREKDPLIKRKSILIAAACSLPGICNTLSQSLAGGFHIQLPDMNSFALTMMAAIIVYSMRKYRLFKLNPIAVAENILTTMSDIYMLSDPKGKIIEVNQTAQELLGYSEAELKGLSIHQVVNNFTGDAALFHQNGVKNLETELRRKDNNNIYVSLSTSLLLDHSNRLKGIVYIARDITESREMTRKMIYHSTHDFITSLTNRSVFEDKLRELIFNLKYTDQPAALLYLDIDELKIINNTYGHTAGDQFLIQVSSFLKQQIRNTDIVARLGSDEFGILLDNCGHDKAMQIADKICCSIQEFRFTWENNPFNASLSVGVVDIDKNCSDIDKVISDANSACENAKESGGKRVCLYQDSFNGKPSMSAEKQYLQLITNGLEGNHFQLYFQMITPTLKGSQKDIHCELLLRLIDNEGKVISPAVFLPIAHRYRLMQSIDRWVVRQFFRFYDKIRHKVGNYLFNINLSGATLNNSGFLEYVTELLETHQVPPEVICFEITETEAISNFAEAKELIIKMKKMGCSFALDDFGNGLSSFNYLKYLPVDYLKIDGSFVKDIIHNDIDCAIVKSTNEIGHLMNLRTIAEYVENEAIFLKLQEMGIDYAQGYWFSKPQPLETMALEGLD